MSLNKNKYSFFEWYRENKNTVFAEYLLEEGLNKINRKIKTLNKCREIWNEMPDEDKCHINMIYREKVNKIIKY